MFTQAVFTVLAISLGVAGIAIPIENLDNFAARGTTIVYTAPLIGTDRSPFYIPVELGSQNISFPPQIDTGSFDFYTPNFDFNASSTVDYEYEGEAVWGYAISEVSDYVSFGGAPKVRLEYGVSHQAVGDGTGIIGASYAGDALNYFQVLKQQNLTDKAVFSFWYDTDGNVKRYDPQGSRQGQLVIGGYDQAKFEGPIGTVNVTNPGTLWTAPVDGIFTPDGVKHFEGQTPVFDTGNFYITIPYDDLRSIQKALPGSTYNGGDRTPITYDGDHQFTDDEKLIFQIGGTNLTIHLSDLALFDGFDTNLQITGGDDIAFGSAFLKNVYSVFNIDDQTISFATRRYTNETDLQRVQ